MRNVPAPRLFVYVTPVSLVPGTITSGLFAAHCSEDVGAGVSVKLTVQVVAPVSVPAQPVEVATV